MELERLTSRKNPYIQELRALAADGEYRRRQGQYVCDGMKLLREAVDKGAELCSVLWREKAETLPGLESVRQYLAPAELFDYASPMKNSPGPVFTVRLPQEGSRGPIRRAIALETVQDPGNLGTVVRTALGLGVDAVILCGDCADLYSPKAARATMGAVFRQRVIRTDLPGLKALAVSSGLPLYGAALTESARDIRGVDVKNAVIAVGSEGQGLSGELLELCDGQVIIPMEKDSQSLNAAAAAAVIMWEMCR